jgi:hypothetical protein
MLKSLLVAATVAAPSVDPAVNAYRSMPEEVRAAFYIDYCLDPAGWTERRKLSNKDRLLYTVIDVELTKAFQATDGTDSEVENVAARFCELAEEEEGE